MRRLLGSIAVALALAAPAAAQTPPPTVLRFDETDPPGHYTASVTPIVPGCPTAPVRDTVGAHSRPTFLFALCETTLHLSFAVPQASVQLFARAQAPLPVPELIATARSAAGAVIATATVADPSPAIWKPVRLAAPAGTSLISFVEIRAEGANIGIDDLAISPLPQPDTTVLGGPPARADSNQATFDFGANRPDVAGWQCALDGAPLTSCTPPVTYTGLAEGPHTFRAAAVDDYGGVDPSPSEYSWTVLGPPPETPLAPGAQPVVSANGVTLAFAPPGGGAASYQCSVDGGPFETCSSPFTATGLAPGLHTLDVRAVDVDGRPDPTPERWTFDVPGARVLPGIPDLDRDRIPDPDEVLPLGNVPPVAGVRTLATLISGVVYVKLPGRAAKQAAPLTGFVPLKGIAALPVGSIVDARRGALALQTAADGRAIGDPRRRLGQARLSSAIFQIRQARLRRASLRARAIATQLVLVSPPGAEAGCRARKPTKRVVRTLTANAKGLFRVSGGASRAEARNAVWRTTDRCSGTTTTVTRGIVRLYDKRLRRTVIVRAGHRYTVKVRLFQARKGRRAG